jgi:spermidine/putrescine transport system permease protein
VSALTSAGESAARGLDRPRASPRTRQRGTRKWLRENALCIYAALALSYLFLPIAYVTVFSFNDANRSNIVWRGFTLENWKNPCGASGDVCTAVRTSIEVGLLSTALATVLGTLMAFAIQRHRFRGRTAINVLIFLPMATPEVVMGASLLTLFLNMGGVVTLGFWTIVISHVMFSLSFVVVTVKARIASLDPSLEEAAKDLYADDLQTFRRVTLPLVAPGIAAAALLAFSLSFDDYIVTTFNSGTVNTFPKYVYTAAQRGIPAQVYVFGAGMFYLALLTVLLAELLRQRRSRGS